MHTRIPTFPFLHQNMGTTYLPCSANFPECLSGKVYQDKITPLKASPHLATSNYFPTKVFDRRSFSIYLFKLLIHRADRQTHLWQATVSFCFWLFSHWWWGDRNAISEHTYMCVCLYQCMFQCVHAVRDTIALRLELNLLTVSFTQDAGTYCYSVTFDPIHSICSVPRTHVEQRGRSLMTFSLAGLRFPTERYNSLQNCCW